MKSRFTKLLRKPLIRYLIVGGSVYLLELVIIVLAQQAGWSAVAAVALAFWIGLLVSFVLQKFVTFSDFRTHHHVVVKQLLATGLLILWNFGFTIVVTKALSPHLPATVVRTVALLITTLWNFYLYKTSIFREPENPVY